MSIRKGYSDGPEGQIHWRMTGEGAPDLYCFSPAPFSGIAYSAILPLLARGRRVIAPDYPGQGGSDGDTPTPSIEDYARSMCALIGALSGESPVQLTGFHSGCLVAVEVALRLADQVSHIALVDVPAFDPETRAKYLPMTGAPYEPTLDLTSQEKAWERAVTSRVETQPLERSLEMFADQVANGPRQNATFHAAFTCDVERQFDRLERSATIIATQSGLLEPSRRAASLISGAQLVERLDIQGSVLDQNAAKTADAILGALSG
nr:alpha/beta hydrolase [Hyphomonas sp. Mor2]